MRWTTNNPRGWVKKFAWLPKVIDFDGHQKKWVWMGFYKELKLGDNGVVERQ